MSEHSHLIRLQKLRLYGMAEAWRELQAEGHRQALSNEALLLRLLDAEQADRQARSLSYQLKAARFPVHRDLSSIDWSETPLESARIEQLASGSYCKRPARPPIHRPLQSP
ncbi:ATP-binding protein [Vogesella fluminis]|uniref:ATP-binding protein n=1 Tax=Vogesella fluminis TaxID=1069161 RepID=UPI00363DFA9A